MNGRVAIAEKFPNRGQKELMSAFKTKMNRLSSGLDVATQFGISDNGFVRAEVEGSDSEFFIELIKKEMKLAPQNLSELEINDNLKAFVSGTNARRQSIEVEIGPVSTNVKCEISRDALMAQLCDGHAIPVDRVAQVYCIQENCPILVRVTSIDLGRRQIEAWVSDDQVARFEQWRRERMHRIIAIGGSHDKVSEAVRLSKSDRDIIQIEKLSFTTNCLVCKLGTDAPGIIAKIGRHLGEFKLYAFLPEKLDRLRIGPTGRR